MSTSDDLEDHKHKALAVSQPGNMSANEETPLLGRVQEGPWYEQSPLRKQIMGIGLALLSGILMTAYSSMLKLLVEMDTMQVAAMRGVMQALVMAAMMLYKGLEFRATRELRAAGILFWVAVTGGFRLLFIFTSFGRIPIGDAATILFSSPVIVMAESICCLQERCGFFRISAALSLVTGVVMIAKPPILFGSPLEGGSYDLLGYSLALGACFMSATGLVLTKLIAKQVEKTTILFYLGVASFICGGAGLLSFGHPSLSPPGWEWGLAFGICFLGLTQQYCLIWAVVLESPAKVTVIRTLQIIFAYGVQVLLFDQMPVVTDLIGAGMVIITVVCITFEKKIREWVPCALF